MAKAKWFNWGSKGRERPDQENESELPVKEEEYNGKPENESEITCPDGDLEKEIPVADEDSFDEDTVMEKRKKSGLFDKLKDGLKKTRESITNRIDQVLVSFGKIDEELFEELEEILITSDMGMETSTKIIAELRTKVKEEKITDTLGVRRAIKEIISSKLTDENAGFKLDTKPSVIVVIGVNGVGKTTSIGKIAYMLKSQGKKVAVAAADTFRAAAIDQLEIWTKRAGVELVKHNEGADPSAVIYDAIQHCKSKGADVLICDTAGRLHTKKNLMEELKKVYRIIDRELPDADVETLLVLDATTGQNAVSQARTFSEVSVLSGLILTKLDGTAKGGIIVSIKTELNIPVKFVGVGEQMNDLQQFNPGDFVEALFGTDR
jgi:fused signal recognition particle receptor